MHCTPTQCQTFVTYDDDGQKTRLNFILFNLTTTSIITEILVGPLKILISSYTDFNVASSSGSDSNLKY